MSTITKHFLRGILVLIPIVATVYVVWWISDTISPLFQWVGERIPIAAAETQLAVGVAVTVTLITFIGMITTNFLGARLVGLIERLFAKVPLIRLLHSSIKDLLGAFVGDKKSFDQPVLVSLSEDGATRIAGFVTREDLEFLGIRESVAVYIPQSYNFAGNLLIVAKDRVARLDTPSSDVLAFLVSGGISPSSD